MQTITHDRMKTASALLMALIMTGILAAPALGSGCPGKMAEIDQRLADGPMLDAAALEEVVSLRAEGDAMHRQGRHGEAMAALGEALAILDEEAAAGHHDHY